VGCLLGPVEASICLEPSLGDKVDLETIVG